jgi:hypothetical protein
VSETEIPIRPSLCPVCGAADAFVDRLHEGAEYYVECVNCRVYRASRRAFRHFEYLRGKADAQSLERLERLASVLRQRARGGAVQLDYDNWHELIRPQIST